MLERECPGLSVSLSHEVAREWREYERASSVVLERLRRAGVEGYLKESGNADRGARRPGDPARDAVERRHHDLDEARRIPFKTLLSGPVGGTIGGGALARAIDRPNLLCVDMGGTSFDLSLIIDGHPDRRRPRQISKAFRS